jgi:glutathione S-transferase
MKLYHFPVAPNPAKVLFYLNEKHISDIELCLVDFRTGAHREPQHLARSPQGVLPILELEDGTCLGESLAIIEYLEELYPTPPMIGDNPLQRHQTRAMERFIEMNVLLRIVRIVHATASPLGLPPNPALAASEMARLPSALETLDQCVGDGPFVLGERVTIADCTLLAACNFARLGKLDIVHTYDNLNQWFGLYALRHL